MTTFQELSLSAEISRAVSQMGFEEPTPIQAMTIPLVMQGRDVIGRAQMCIRDSSADNGQ